jgi:hypothetical protein
MLALLIAAACTSRPAAPADLSGQWTLTMDADFNGSRTVVECDLKQQGAERSGVSARIRHV